MLLIFFFIYYYTNLVYLFYCCGKTWNFQWIFWSRCVWVILFVHRTTKIITKIMKLFLFVFRFKRNKWSLIISLEVRLWHVSFFHSMKLCIINFFFLMCLFCMDTKVRQWSRFNNILHVQISIVLNSFDWNNCSCCSNQCAHIPNFNSWEFSVSKSWRTRIKEIQSASGLNKSTKIASTNNSKLFCYWILVWKPKQKELNRQKKRATLAAAVAAVSNIRTTRIVNNSKNQWIVIHNSIFMCIYSVNVFEKKTPDRLAICMRLQNHSI